MVIDAPAIEWIAPIAEEPESQFPVLASAVASNRDQRKKLNEAVRRIVFDDYIRSCLASDASRKRLGLTRSFIAGYLLAEGSIQQTEAGQFKISPTTSFKGTSIGEVYVDQLKIHSYIRWVGRLGFIDIAGRLEELWDAVEEDDDYDSINTTSLGNAVIALVMKRWKQRPLIAVERDGTVAVKWSGESRSLLLAFLPDGRTWYKLKYGEERHVETVRTRDALSLAEIMLSDY